MEICVFFGICCNIIPITGSMRVRKGFYQLIELKLNILCLLRFLRINRQVYFRVFVQFALIKFDGFWLLLALTLFRCQ